MTGHLTGSLALRGCNLARLPKAERAIIEGEKLRGYILSSTHPVGRFKAAFFNRFGYSTENREGSEQGMSHSPWLGIHAGASETSAAMLGSLGPHSHIF